VAAEIGTALATAQAELGVAPAADTPTDARGIAALLAANAPTGSATAEQRRLFDRAVFAVERRTGDALRVRSRTPGGPDAWFWSDDGHHLVTFSQRLDGEAAALVFDASGGEPLFAFSGRSSWDPPRFSADQRILLWASASSPWSGDDQRSLLDLTTGHVTSFGPSEAVLFGPDGRSLLINRSDAVGLSVLALPDLRLLATRDRLARSKKLLVSPNGRSVLLVRPNDLELLALPELRQLATREGLPEVVDAEFAPDGSFVALTLTGSKRLSYVSLGLDGATLAPLFGPFEAQQTEYRSDLGQVALADPDDGAWVVRALPSGALVRRAKLGAQASGVFDAFMSPTWTPDGRRLIAVSGWSPFEIRSFDLASGRTSIWRGGPNDGIRIGVGRLAFTEDGQRLCVRDLNRSQTQCPLVIGASGTLGLAPLARGWDTAVLHPPLRAIDVPARLFDVPGTFSDNDVSHAMDLSTDRRRFGYLRSDGESGDAAQARLELYDTATWRLVLAHTWPLRKGDYSEQAVTFSPRGDTVTATLGGKRYVLDTTTGRILGELPMGRVSDATGANFLRAAYRPDGAAVLSGSSRLDTRTGVVTKLMPAMAYPNTVMLSAPVADRILLAGPEGTAHLVRPDLTGDGPVAVPFAADQYHAAIAFSADGSLLATATPSGVSLVATTALHELWSTSGVAATAVALSADGARLAWAGEPKMGEARIHVVSRPDGNASSAGTAA
jgi:hypothetical protein